MGDRIRERRRLQAGCLRLVALVWTGWLLLLGLPVGVALGVTGEGWGPLEVITPCLIVSIVCCRVLASVERRLEDA